MKYELNRPGEPFSSSHSAKRVANTKLHFSVRPNPYAALPDEGDRLCRFGGGEVPGCWKLKNPGDLLAAAVVLLLRYPVVADPPRGCIATEYPSRLRCKRWAENVIHSARVQSSPGGQRWAANAASMTRARQTRVHFSKCCSSVRLRAIEIAGYLGRALAITFPIWMAIVARRKANDDGY